MGRFWLTWSADRFTREDSELYFNGNMEAVPYKQRQAQTTTSFNELCVMQVTSRRNTEK